MSKQHLVIEIPGRLFETDKAVGISSSALNMISEVVQQFAEQSGIMLSIGFSNFQAHVPHTELETPRYIQDYTASLAAQINGVLLLQALDRKHVPTKMLSAIDFSAIEEFPDSYSKNRALQYIESGNVVISIEGVEQGLYDEDLSAAIRALEINAAYLYKPVYFNDYAYLSNWDAKKSRIIGYGELLGKSESPVSNSTVALCQQHQLPIVVFDPSLKNISFFLKNPENLGQPNSQLFLICDT